MGRPARLRARLRAGPPLLLDGPTGTELDRRGVPLDSADPAWSARSLRDAPALVEAIHRDYVAAGAELHTANTFRTDPTTLAAAGLADEAGPMVQQAIRCARAAIEARPEGAADDAWVLGSLAPLGDCYRPDEVPDQDKVEAAHAAQARLIHAAGADGFLVETMNTVREARAAVRAARATGLPVLASLVVGPGGRLLSGEALAPAVAAVVSDGAEAVLVNCASLQNTSVAMPHLAAAAVVPFGAYANIGTTDPQIGWEQGRDVTVDEYVDAASDWLAQGARIIGSCCGTTPRFTRALRRLLDGTRE